MNLDIPLAKFELDINKVQEALFQRYYKIQKLIASAFSELADAAFNADGNAQRVYNVVAENLTDGTKKNLYDTDFLNKMKNYNRNLRADFDYFFKSKFERKKAASNWENAISGESFLEVMQSAEIDGKKKAQIYAEKICEILDIIKDMQETDKSTYGFLNSGHYMPSNENFNFGWQSNDCFKWRGLENYYVNNYSFVQMSSGEVRDYFVTNKKFSGVQIFKIIRENVLKKLHTYEGYYGFLYTSWIAHWFFYEWSTRPQIGGAREFHQTWIHYNSFEASGFANLGKESYEFLQKFYEIGQSPMIQNYLQGIEIEVFNDPNNEQLDFGENNNK